MKGWQFTEIHKPLTLVELPDPTAGLDEVKIEVKTCGLCHSDVGIIEGVTTSALGKIPLILGHEIAGIITELGEGVTDFQVGDRVAVIAGADTPGVVTDGGYANVTVSPTKFVVKIPDEVTFEEASSATDAGNTAYHAIATTGEVKEGEKVGIIGLGGLGYLGVQIALALGAKVYGVELREEARAAVEAFNVEKCVSDLSELADENLDVIIDFAGFGTTTAAAIDYVRPGGRIVLIGLGKGEATISSFKFVTKSLTMKSSIGGTREDLAEMFKLMAAKKVVPKITKIGFNEIPEGLKQLEEGKVTGRLVAVIDN